jgi:hypothetical protein
MSKVKTIKNIIKKSDAQPSTFGTDPRDPWSAKANLAESKGNPSGLLAKYLKSRGINPRYVTKDQKVAHSKTGQFNKWKSDHMAEQTMEPSPTTKRLKELKKSQRQQTPITRDMTEAVDKKDTITFDIPLLIRVLEFAREDLKSDINLHKMVERLLSIRGRGVLTMNEYGRIIKEEVESERLDEISVELQHRYFKAAHAQKYDKTGTTPKATKQKRSKGMDKVVSRTLKRNVIGLPKGVDPSEGGKYTADSVEVEGTPLQEGSAALRMAKALQKAKQERELKDQSREAREKQQQTPPVKENMEPLAACAQPGDGANTPDDVAPKDKNKKLIQMSKSARIIKSIYKRKGMSEELYDHEKEDKSTAPLGKKPKVQKLDADSLTKEAPQAAAVLTGGKTMTGEPRDTIEIDPMMKMRKQSGNSQKSV